MWALVILSSQEHTWTTLLLRAAGHAPGPVLTPRELHLMGLHPSPPVMMEPFSPLRRGGAAVPERSRGPGEVP